jgi:DNA replication protein DnaC
MGVSAFILIHAIKNLKEAMVLFLEKAPQDVAPEQVKHHLSSIDGILDIHHIHLWSINGETTSITMHIVTDSNSGITQKQAKDLALEYVNEPGANWFLLSGQPGCGKTHLCTAICREFLLEGKQVIYMLWRDDIAKIKSLAMEPEERQKLIDRFKQAEVLYIDDLFKTGRNPDGSEPKPTAADINAAFEVINYRYNNPGLLTVISSELNEDELLDIDEAVGGRIFERSKSISIAKNRERNYRIRKAVTL